MSSLTDSITDFSEILTSEIDRFEAQIALRKLGKIDEKVFAETRLRHSRIGKRCATGHGTTALPLRSWLTTR